MADCSNQYCGSVYQPISHHVMIGDIKKLQRYKRSGSFYKSLYSVFLLRKTICTYGVSEARW
jgi:hypothetical protein